LLCFFSGCIGVSYITATTGANESLIRDIPRGSKVVIVEKENIEEDDLYNEVYDILLSRGHRIQKDDHVRHFITTEGKDVGESTLQRMTLVVTGTANGAKLKITTEWKPGTQATLMATAVSGIPIFSDWAEAKWEINRLGIAFSESVVIASQIKNSYVYYDLSEKKPPINLQTNIQSDVHLNNQLVSDSLSSTIVNSENILIYSSDEAKVYIHPDHGVGRNFEPMDYKTSKSVMTTYQAQGDFVIASKFVLQYISQNQNLLNHLPSGWYWSDEEGSDGNVLCVQIETGDFKKISNTEKAYLLPILLGGK
jgi:hypothetical protein